MTFLAALIAVVLVVMGLFFTYLIFGTSRPRFLTAQAWASPIRFPHRESTGQLPYDRKPLLSAWERRALLSLRAQIPAGFYICPQVRLIDMLLVGPVTGFARQTAIGKVASKSVDFAIVALATGDIVLVIELDDKTHDQPERRERDRFVNAVLERAGIPVRRFRPDTPIHVRDFFALNDAVSMKGTM
jgi:very-short-patch-repair endonuclease